MKTLRTNKISDCDRIGIIMAEEWFGMDGEQFSYLHSSYRNFYVVGKWYEYSNGHGTTIEGKHTIAICEKFQDAENVLLNNYHTLVVNRIDPIIDYIDVLTNR